jgi:hypothetical protein
MLKETITYEDFDGVSTTEDMYFHLTKLELTEMAMDLPDGLADNLSSESTPEHLLTAITARLGRKGIIDFIKALVIKAYGIRSVGQDGKTRFMKSEQIATDFANSMACHAFIMELMSDDDRSARFFNGIVPSELAAQLPADFQNAVTTK